MGIVRWVVEVAVYGGAILAASSFLPGMKVKDLKTAFIVALVFAVLNALLGWALTPLAAILTFPIWFLSCFTLFFVVPLVVNAALLWLTDKLMQGLKIEGWIALFGTSALVSLAQALFHLKRR